MKPDKYYFDNIYSKKKDFAFKYNKEILKDILKQKKSGRILDLGCGEGGISLYLAQKGFDVTCMDISEIAIKKIKKEATKRKIKIKTIHKDLEDYKINKKYDIIIACGILQFLGEQGKTLIKQMKSKTNKNGINIIDAFINKWLSKRELEEIYSNWELIKNEEYVWRKKDKFKMIYLIAIK